MKDYKYALEIIRQEIKSSYICPEVKYAFEANIEALEKQIPKKPIIERWSPSLCPSCKEELSESMGDGYYKHWTSKNICDCGQKLKWDDDAPYSKEDYDNAKLQGLDLDDWCDYVEFYGLGEREEYE